MANMYKRFSKMLITNLGQPITREFFIDFQETDASFFLNFNFLKMFFNGHVPTSLREN